MPKGAADFRITTNTYLFFLFAFICLGSYQAFTDFRWPLVKPVHEKFRVKDPHNAAIKTIITDQAGKPLYLFICRTMSDKTHPKIFYANDLDCRLFEASEGEVEETLLLETDDGEVAPWFSRGRMYADQLWGACASYPEYGRVRHFRLRGMKLTMEFDDIRFAPTKEGTLKELASYTLCLTVEPDPSATSIIAESSGYLDPQDKKPDRQGCSVVLKGNEWGKK